MSTDFGKIVNITTAEKIFIVAHKQWISPWPDINGKDCVCILGVGHDTVIK